MKWVTAHIAILLAWMALSGQWSGQGLIFGLLLGTLVLSLLPPGNGRIRYVTRLYRIGRLFVVFLREFALSVFRVAALVLSPRPEFHPGLFRFPLTVTSDIEIALLANLITLTPGTLTVDVTDDRSALLVHAIDCRDPDRARRDIADGFERLIREAFQ